jgi:predicted nucleotidyltransferase
MLDPVLQDELVKIILQVLPQTQAIYLFGSFAKDEERDESDLDLALYFDIKPDPETIFLLKGQISALVKRDLDLVDLLRADTVTQAQVVSGSRLLYAHNEKNLAFFETRVLSQYVQLNLERRDILKDIVQRGRVYGR